MLYFTSFVISLAMTVALIPSLIRYANRLNLVDQPDARKVHSGLIPRVGGIGMVFGMLISAILWAPVEQELQSLLFGICVITVFGIWDDRGDLDYRLKFLGQFIAAAIVVIYGDVVVEIMPFMGFDPVPYWVSFLFTIIALVAVTNAINLADGLDGLAAGVSMISLAGITILTYFSNDLLLMPVCIALMGSVAGFIRYNTYPARIFMGDTGSQFLGFSIATLLVILTQNVSVAINPAIPLLVLGVPLFDTLFVMARRIYYGKSPFSPDKNHIHHQLLALNFDHYEAVVIIYVVQFIFVILGVTFRYESDLLVVGLWLMINTTLLLVMVCAGRSGWRAHQQGAQSFLSRWVNSNYKQFLYKISIPVLKSCLVLLLVFGPLLTEYVETSTAIISAVMCLALLLRLVFGYRAWFLSLRFIMYLGAALVVYVLHKNMHEFGEFSNIAEYIFYGLLAFALVVETRYKIDTAFEVNPTDYLVVMFMIGYLLLFPEKNINNVNVLPLVVKIIAVFYSVEVVLHNMQRRWTIFTLSMVWSFGVIAAKGML